MKTQTVNGFEVGIDFYAGDRAQALREGAEQDAAESVAFDFLQRLTAAQVVDIIARRSVVQHNAGSEIPRIAATVKLLGDTLKDDLHMWIADELTAAIADAGHDTSGMVVYVRIAEND